MAVLCHININYEFYASVTVSRLLELTRVARFGIIMSIVRFQDLFGIENIIIMPTLIWHYFGILRTVKPFFPKLLE